ncbi:hypothetical protein SRHO_G00095680 [Serrasalmus rhombeus]
MHCLNWILALTFLHYVTAAPTGSKSMYSTLILHNIETLENATCLSDDSEFYSVSPNQHDSIDNALCCARKELKTVAGECFQDCTTIELNKCFKIPCLQTRDYIQQLLKNDTNPEVCIKCEAHPRTSYKKFLSDLKTLVQMFYSNLDTSN